MCIGWLGGLVVLFINLYLFKLYCVGYVLFNRLENGGLVSFGGYVMSFKFGFYKYVLVLDFKSFYFLIICIFKIDFLGLVEGFKYFDDVILGFKGVVFYCENYFLFDIISSLWK